MMKLVLIGPTLRRFVVCSIVLWGCANICWAQNESRLIRVRDRVTGRESSLFEKVVVTSARATLADAPDQPGEPLEPWAIFFRIRNNNGSTTAINGKLRVGDQSGNPLGWIGQEHLRTWSTRFILDPIEPAPDRAFEVIVPGGSAKQNATPEGKRRYALITEPPLKEQGDDTEYPVVVYAGNVQSLEEAGTLARQRNELSDVKLEIMFVIESSDFMFAKPDDSSPPLMDIVKQSIRDVISQIRQDPAIAAAVRLGFSEYKDGVPKATFTSRLTRDLTGDFNAFSSALDQLQPSKLEDDWPDDVLAGVNEAVSNASWSENSVKHIILLGMASAQLSGRGQNPPQTGKPGSIYEQIISSLVKPPMGYNSTGMSIAQLVAKGRPQGGASRSRSTKMFHAMHFGKELFDGIPPDERAELRQSIDDLDREINKFTLNEIITASDDPEFAGAVGIMLNLHTYEHQRTLALAQYRDIAHNNGEVDGIFAAVPPEVGKQRQAIDQLSGKIRDTFKILEDVREGRGMQAGQNSGNEIAQPLFTLVGAAAEKFKDSEVIDGHATVRDQRGREVAFKKVMVSEKELRHLKSTLDALYTKFQGKSSKADRQDVGAILENLKEILAETSAGQDLTADVKLKDLISDLPLRTAALDTSAADLALMTTEAFGEWLDRLNSAQKRIGDLLDSSGDWLTLSDKAVNDRFTFLRLSELP